MSLRINDPAHTLSPAPIRGHTIPLDPSVGTMKHMDSGVLLDMTFSRQFAPWLDCDAVSANRTQVQGPFVAGSRAYIAGAEVIELAGFLTVPTDSGATAKIVFGANAVAGGLNFAGMQTTNNALVGYFASNGFTIFQIGANATNNYADSRSFSHTTLRSLYSGQKLFFRARITKGTATNPRVWFNETEVSAGFTLSTNGTVPDWLSATNFTPTYLHVGNGWTAGEAPLISFLNGTLSDSEALSWMITGKPPAWVQPGGSQRSILSSGSAFDSVWIQSWVTVAANTTAAPDSTVTADTITETATTQQHYVSQAVQFNAGIYEFSFYAKTNGRSVYFEMGSLRAAYDFSTAVFTAVNSYAATWSAVSGSATDVGSGWVLFRMRGICLVPGSYICKMHTTPNGNAYLGLLYAGDGTSGIFLADARVLPIGALSLPRPQANGTVDDWTAIGGNTARTVGMRCITDDPFWRLVASVDSSSTGNKQLLSGAVLADPDKQALDFVDVETDGSVTFSLGDGTTATRYTASTAVTAGRTRVALSSPFPADAAKTGLYTNVTVAGGTYLRFVISGHRTL